MSRRQATPGILVAFSAQRAHLFLHRKELEILRTVSKARRRSSFPLGTHGEELEISVRKIAEFFCLCGAE